MQAEGQVNKPSSISLSLYISYWTPRHNPTLKKRREENHLFLASTMAITSAYSTIHHGLYLHSANSTPLLQVATHRATVAEPPPQQQRRASTAIKLPTTLSNILHLNLSGAAAPLPSPSPPVAHQTPAYSPTENISSLRREIHGSGDWSPLLDPLHPWLRREIVKYGEFSQATYDGFDFNPFSPYCGSALYNRGRLFDQLGLTRHGYNVTKYLYAMSHVALPRWLERSIRADTWSNDSNWMGFVAVSDDAESRRIGCRDITVAWRGTIAPTEWLEDLQGKLEPLGQGHGEARVEHGFLSIYTSKSDTTRYSKTSASEQVMQEIKKLVKHFKERGEEVSITITGHSLGGALALLNAYEAATEIPDVPVSVISFGAPRVGNKAFGERLEAMGVKALRVAAKQDLVPKVPGVLFNEGFRPLEGKWVYTHVGVELGVDVRESPYLKRGLDLPGFHSLETYLHLVDGFAGAGKGFRREAKRDPALVNKATGMLREEMRVPACWYQAANKGMVCNEYGRWAQPQRDPEDIPSPYRDGPAPMLRLTEGDKGLSSTELI